MDLDGLPKVDKLFSEDLDAQIARVIQKVFMIGVLVGKNQITDDMNAMATPLSQSVATLLQDLGKLVPNVQNANQLFHPLLAKTEDMAKIDFSSVFKENLQKSEKHSREAQQKNLTPNMKRLEVQHDKIVSDLIGNMEHDQKTTIQEIINETVRHKPKKK